MDIITGVILIVSYVGCKIALVLLFLGLLTNLEERF